MWTLRVTIFFIMAFLYLTTIILACITLDDETRSERRDKDFVIDAGICLGIINFVNICMQSGVPSIIYITLVIFAIIFTFAFIVDEVIEFETVKSCLQILAIALVLGVFTFAIRADIYAEPKYEIEEEPFSSVVYEYEIVSQKDGNFGIYEMNGQEEFLKEIPIKSLKIKIVDWVANPYIYREKKMYHQYDTSGETPVLVEEIKEEWSDYVICGSKSQLEFLLGELVVTTFEQ